MDDIIQLSNVSMQFNLEEEKTDSLKEYVLKLLSGKLHFNSFYALKDISLSVKRGDSVALIGLNGSGKSTLLKVIAGVLKPTTGNIVVRGSIAPLIELGAGFDMNLTARENIYLNGAVLGYDRTFINQHFDDIVNFAEIRDFLDVPIKNFSSGMVARLGFSIATLVRSDILIVDEVLTVGDYLFQKKCELRMQELLQNGTTLLFVSHSADQVRSICQKAAWLNRGELVKYGSIEEVLPLYEQSGGSDCNE